MSAPFRYRRSVWWEVAAVVSLLLFFAGPLAYLTIEYSGPAVRMSESRDRVVSDRSAHRASRASPPRSHWGPRSRTAPRSDGPVANAPAGGGYVPFSSAWRERTMSGLSPGGGGPARRPSSPEASGIRGDDVRLVPLGGRSSARRSEPGRRSGQGDWASDVQKLGSHALALSSELGKMDRGDRARQTEEGGGRGRTSSASASSSSGAGGPPLPPTPEVPIDDHLHWLLAAGLLWGAWRLWGGG